jgi:hypothetical protein
MGDLIHIEQLRIAREEQLRRRTIRQFPWEEMKDARHRSLDPLVRHFTDTKRVILLELAYRLAYESFLCGVKAALNQAEHERAGPLYTGGEEEETAAAKSLAHRLLNEFAASRWLEEGWTETVTLLLEQLAEDWYQKGLAAGLARS